MKKINFSSKRGFTLIELLVVIGILAVLAAIMIPMVSGVIMKANVSADKTNSNEMTNSIERFASEYELYCQDIASGKIKNVANLDGAQGRVYNVTLATTRSDIEKLESEDGFNGRAIDGDTNYPTNRETARAIIQTYEKTSSATFEPKQSDAHYYYSPDCGVVVAQDTAKSDVASLNALVPSGLDASGKALDSNTEWIDLTEEVSIDAGSTEEVTNYTLDEINANEHLYAIGKTKPEYVVAKFNDDYSEVIICANSKDSDGIMRDWYYPGSPMSQNAATLKTAIVKDGMIQLGLFSFSHCDNLTSIDFGHTLVCIEACTFNYCYKLDNIVFPTSLRDIKDSAFNDTGLTSINIPNFVTNVEVCAFSNCKKLTTVTLPNTMTNISPCMFRLCESLETIVIPNSVKTISKEVFEYCYNLNTIYLPKSITSVGKIDENGNLPRTFFTIADNAIIYCETQEVADLLEKDIHYNGTTQVVVDPSKF